MKMMCKKALLIPVILLVLVGFAQAQIIAPPAPADVQVPMDILVGLIGRYMAMIQQYQNMIAQGGAPGSAMEFRLAANITIEGNVDSELSSILTNLSQLTIWIKANIFSEYPYLKVELTGSLGDIELLATTTESIIVSPNEGIYAPVPLGTETAQIGDVMDLVPLGEENILPEGISLIDAASFLSPEALPELLGEILAAYLPLIAMEYDGLDQTPKGIAHVVRMTSIETGATTTLWVLDETWDLYKVEIADPYYGINIIVIIEGIELVAVDIPESAFDVDIENLVMISYDEFVMALALKFFSVAVVGVPVAADLSLSLPVVNQGEQVIVSTNGMDSDDAESALIVQVEYRGPNGLWTPLEGASYVGVSPQGHWEVVFAPPISELPGSYDFKVTYTDTLGLTSDPLELLGVLIVIAVPPEVLSVSPADQSENVSVSSSLIVTFSQEMDIASAESAFSLAEGSPAGQAVSGSFEWSDATLTFSPAEDLAYNQEYSAKILGTAVGLSTATLGDDFVWSFTTESAPLPEATIISPSSKQLDVVISTHVSVAFNYTMDQASVESAFSLTSSDGQAVSGSFQWTDNTLTFVPAQNLYYNTTYQVMIRGSAKSALGVGLDTDADGVAEGIPEDDLSWWFSTETFPVFAVKPVSRSVNAGDLVTIEIIAQAMSELRSFALTVDYDPAVLSILNVELVSFAMWRPRPRDIEDVDIWQPTVIDDDQGLIVIAADSTRAGGVSGTGTIATLSFQAVGLGESPISLQNVAAANDLGEDIAPGLRDGSVQVIAIEPWDVNGDGVVDINDFIIIQSDRGANTDVNGDGVTDILDMVAATGGAQAAPVLVPVANLLERSFPNPFNPETWIPYQLAGEADVVIRIYSVTGQLVKALDLGYKLPGRYMTKATAAHWDGTNEIGERVSSGIYYYSIKAGDFTAVRKMVVME